MSCSGFGRTKSATEGLQKAASASAQATRAATQQVPYHAAHSTDNTSVCHRLFLKCEGIVMLMHISFVMQVSSVVQESFSQVSQGVRICSNALVKQERGEVYSEVCPM